MIKVLLIGPSRQQAEFWARVWKLERGTWKYINPSRAHDMHGYSPDTPVYLCGDFPWHGYSQDVRIALETVFKHISCGPPEPV